MADLRGRLEKIRLVALDVDGILTDGKIFWIREQGWTRFYSVKDGYGMILLKKAGIEVAFISAGDSEDLRERAKKIGITRTYLGSSDKSAALDDLLKVTGLREDQVAYMGDELFDIPVLVRAGFSATVPDAPEVVRSKVHHITSRPGGDGAVREVAEMILHAQGKWDLLGVLNAGQQ